MSNKINSAILTIIMMAATPAFADGFVCEVVDGNLKVKVYNHVSPEQGTRNSAVMVLSDKYGTVARFMADQSLLKNHGTSYMAKVDLRYSNIVAKGAIVGSAAVRDLKTIGLDVDFNYSEPIKNGADVEGALLLEMRDGGSEVIPVECKRYLKSE